VWAGVDCSLRRGSVGRCGLLSLGRGSWAGADWLRTMKASGLAPLWHKKAYRASILLFRAKLTQPLEREICHYMSKLLNGHAL
jgi:hypothetical protein